MGDKREKVVGWCKKVVGMIEKRFMVKEMSGQRLWDVIF